MKDNSGMMQMGTSILIWIVTILATYMIVDSKTSSISQDVVASMLTIEYDKVWGMENYLKINEISKKQIVEWLKQYDAWGWAQPQAQNPAPTAQPAAATISPDKAVKITSEWTYVYWNPDAEITWVEYSDLECPNKNKYNLF